MVNYECPRCGYTINIKTKYMNHLRRKTICNNTKSDDTLEKVNAQLDRTKINAKSIIEKAVSESQISSEKIIKDLNFKLNEKIEKSLKDIDKEKSIILKDIFNEAFDLSDLIISKTTNIKSNKSKLTNILKQEVKILT